MYLRYIFISILLLFVTIFGEYLLFITFQTLGAFKYPYVKNIVLTLGVLLPTMFVGAMLYGGKHFSLINTWIYAMGGLWLAIFTYLLMGVITILLLVFINNSFNLNLPIKLISFIIITISTLIILYGVYNANHPRIVKMEVTSSALAPFWGNKKIIIISDVHLGITRRGKFMKKIIDTINTEKPDITFNLGDLIDGPKFPYKEGFASISELNPPLGNFYVEGNHEGYSEEYAVFKENFPKNLNDITEKKVVINNTQIIGIYYDEQKTPDEMAQELSKVGYDKTMPSIILMHDPKDIPMLANNGASLVLSGHTHKGQFFPFSILIKMLDNKYFYGVTQTLNTISITSEGVGTAMAPVRIGTKPEIIVLTIK